MSNKYLEKVAAISERRKSDAASKGYTGDMTSGITGASTGAALGSLTGIGVTGVGMAHALMGKVDPTPALMLRHAKLMRGGALIGAGLGAAALGAAGYAKSKRNNEAVDEVVNSGTAAQRDRLYATLQERAKGTTGRSVAGAALRNGIVGTVTPLGFVGGAAMGLTGGAAAYREAPVIRQRSADAAEIIRRKRFSESA